MKKTVLYFILLFALIVNLVYGQTEEDEAEQKKDIGLFVGLGLNGGSDYSDDLKNAIDGEVTGYTGWLNIEAGLQFKIIEKLYFAPHFRWMTSRIAFSTSGFSGASNTKINYVILYGGLLNYYIFKNFYGQFSLSKMSTSSDISSLQFEPDGMETGFAVGYEIEMNPSRFIVIEVGYTSVPVKSSGGYDDYFDYYDYSGVQPTQSRNYGGLFFNVNALFQLGNYK